MLGTEKADPDSSHIIDALQNYCVLTDADLDVVCVDSCRSTDDGNKVLGNFLFPIINYYETDMVEVVKQRAEFEEVMKKIWFCHNPIDSKPCGMCHPCQVKMESNMEFLLDDSAIKRYKTLKRLEKVFGDKLARKICGIRFRK